MSDEEAMMVTDCNTIRDAAEFLLQKTSAVFAITIGKEGTLLGYKGQTYVVPSIAIEPVDTTGAGDAFVGALLHQLNENHSQDMTLLSIEEWKQIVYNANKAGARTCQYLGAMEAFKHLSSQIFD